jgi:phosphoribosylanthranilate isomerase
LQRTTLSADDAAATASKAAKLFMSVRVKICCIADEQEAADAVAFGASAIGLVAEMPSGPGPISDKEILRIAKTVPPPIATFLLTSEQTSQAIIEHHCRTRTNTIQIVDELEGRDYDKIKAELPIVKIVQVIHVVDESSVDEACGIGRTCRCDSARQRKS